MDMAQQLTTVLSENMKIMDELFTNCDDIKKRMLCLGDQAQVDACIYYVEVAVNNLTIEESVIGKLLSRLMEKSPQEIYDYLDANALGITDVSQPETVEEAVMGVMVGDGVIFIDGYDKALKIKSQGYPMMGVSSSEREQVMRGSREGFADSLKANTALMRKRVRSNNLKVQEFIVGEESNTTIALVYVDGLVRRRVLREIEKRIESLHITNITDSGIIEQLTEENKHSPFPQYQTTERPDTAVMAVMRGRITLFVDNTPVALLLPTNINDFFKTPDDYFERFGIVTLARLIRYLAAFFALTLPAIYLAVMNYHPDVLPANLLLAFANGRARVPFPSIVEVLMMEFAFELLREAGIRIPGPMGSTIGIVGGLIIGQAAVSAGIVSPVIVVVVAFTALSSFAVPNDEFSSAFRILKYFLIGMAYLLGFFGITLGLMLIGLHLASLKSFGLPYLMPIAAGDTTKQKNYRDLFLRLPLKQ
jgi:spore germination protein